MSLRSHAFPVGIRFARQRPANLSGRVEPLETQGGILREHLVDKVPVSRACTKHQLHPSVF